MPPILSNPSPIINKYITNDNYNQRTKYMAPTQITTPDGIVNILQLTDLHLSFENGKVTEHDTELDTETNTETNTEIETHSYYQTCYQSFIACLNQALSEKNRCDLILLTGDLVNEVKPEIYDCIYQILEKTGIPFACIAGNHDVTDEVGLELPYEQRHYVAHQPDARLLTRHCIQLNNWQLLLLDTSVPGKVYGEINDKNLQWLHEILSTSHHPVIIAMHHHVLPIHSAWMDKLMTQDAEKFWELILGYPAVKSILNGHIHQCYEANYEGVSVFSTPSTCYQFLPNSDEFKIDEHSQPGYRWVSLQENGALSSSVNRLSNK